MKRRGFFGVIAAAVGGLFGAKVRSAELTATNPVAFPFDTAHPDEERGLYATRIYRNDGKQWRQIPPQLVKKGDVLIVLGIRGLTLSMCDRFTASTDWHPVEGTDGAGGSGVDLSVPQMDVLAGVITYGMREHGETVGGQTVYVGETKCTNGPEVWGHPSGVRFANG
jgi:hypothetical protein